LATLIVDWYEAMATALYIALIALAGVVSQVALLPALGILALAVILAFRHELQASTANLPHSLIMRG
jgi:hypothetical protein